MMVTMTLRGGEEMSRILRSLSEHLRKEVLYKMLYVAAEPMRERMAQLAPRGSEAHPRGHVSGHLKDNISISPVTRPTEIAGGGSFDPADPYSAAVAIGPARGYFWGVFLEFGTVRMTPQSFARPAFDGERDSTFDDLSDQFWDAMQEQLPTTPSPSGTGLL